MTFSETLLRAGSGITITITPYGKASADIVKEYPSGKFYHTTAIRYDNGVIAYNDPHIFVKEDIEFIDSWFKENR